MEYGERMEDLARAFEVVGVAIIALGAVYAIVAAVVDRPGRQLFKQTRRNFGQPFILGLEVLVAADIIETITFDRSLESAAALGIIVLVRVVLSISLDMEVDGMMPWRRADFEAANPPRAEE
jgi:uncharacterized membrane protein